GGAGGTSGGIVLGIGIKLACASLLLGLTVLAWLCQEAGTGRGHDARGEDPRAGAVSNPSWIDVQWTESAGTRRQPAEFESVARRSGLANQPSGITGWVVDRRGKPVGQAWVGIEDWVGPGVFPSAISGEDGAFTIEHGTVVAREERVVCFDQRLSTLIPGTAPD